MSPKVELKIDNEAFDKVMDRFVEAIFGSGAWSPPRGMGKSHFGLWAGREPAKEELRGTNGTVIIFDEPKYWPMPFLTKQPSSEDMRKDPVKHLAQMQQSKMDAKRAIAERMKERNKPNWGKF